MYNCWSISNGADASPPDRQKSTGKTAKHFLTRMNDFVERPMIFQI